MAIKVGKRFGKLQVIYTNIKSANVLIKCDCITIKEVRRRSLTSRHTRSCGCQKYMTKPRKIIDHIDGVSALVKLTRGQYARIDKDDIEKVSGHAWHAKWNQHTRSFYAAAWGRGENGMRRTTIWMHRLFLNAPNGIEVDHYSHDTLDNRRSNLRLAPDHHNSRNKNLQMNNTSGFKGVYLDKEAGKWRVAINVGGKHMNLGRFLTAEEAGTAYDKAALELYGEFARTNAMIRGIS
jgi:hypothetical protein